MVPLPTRFDADLYAEFRPEYPEEIFRPLLACRSVLDVGCGTGLSLKNFERSDGKQRRLTGLDRDPVMLDQARAFLPGVEWMEGTAEQLPFSSGEFEAVITGSAFHWFAREAFAEEAARVLTPYGHLLVFEYQFPKALKNPDLNEWARRQFNLKWRAPGQTPRGSLRQISDFLRSSPVWYERTLPVPRMLRSLTVEQFYGQLISQSRYQHSEATLTSETILLQRQQVFADLQIFFGDAPELEFDFHLSAYLFQKR